MEALLIVLLISVILFLLCMGVLSLMRAGRERVEDTVSERLRSVALADDEREKVVDVLRQSSAMSDVPWFNRMLMNMRVATNMRRLISQADAKGTPGLYLLSTLVLFLAVFYVVITATGNLLGAGILAYLIGFIPIFILKRKKARRMNRFTAQLPDALDLMTRALKAGHTFNGSMRMVADEFDDPIGVEFRQTLEEINYGKDPDAALADLLDRVDCPDLKFFVVSVNIQRETGGNLAEIISNIARLVRERFQLFGKIRVLSAEGRISAIILTGLPFAVALVLYLINPEYMSVLYEEEFGRTMAFSAMITMGVGIIAIRKMIKIKI